MSASSGRDQRHMSVSDPAAPPLDGNGEPVGYNLGAIPSFEQPPSLMAQQDLTSTRDPLSTRQATIGLVLSVLGVVATGLVPFNVPLIGTGIVLSAAAMTRCARGEAAGRRRALAGFVIGILGVFALFIMFLDFANGFTVLIPHQ